MKSAINIACLVLFVASTSVAHAAVSLYPNELYGGMNVVSIDASSGIRRIQWNDGTRWHDLRKGQSLRNLRIVSVTTPSRCVRLLKVYLFVPDISRSAGIELRVLECGGNSQTMDLSTGQNWRVDHQRMGTPRVGETVCQPFSVRTDGTGAASIVVDRVVAASGNFELRFGGKKPPVYIASGRTYSYDVCFRATKPGVYKMPIHVYIRRRYPAGGFTSFIVADTAYVTVLAPLTPPRVRANKPAPLPKPKPALKPAAKPAPKPRVRIETPRPIVILPPAPPPPPPRVPNVATVTPRAMARPVMPFERERLRAHDAIEQVVFEPDVIDPTTFRVVLLPTARSIGEGRGFIASYDIAGVLAGYGVTERLTVLAGGLYLPRIGDGSQTIDVTAGARYEIVRDDFVRVATGVQLNQSITDSSSIGVVAPFAVASIGDDDSRASIALSYAARRHTPETGESFTREALVAAAGGDVRVARNWKIAAEGFVVEGIDEQTDASRGSTSDAWGATATVRYFGERFALDAGALVSRSGGGRLAVAPVVSFIWVWGQ